MIWDKPKIQINISIECSSGGIQVLTPEDIQKAVEDAIAAKIKCHEEFIRTVERIDEIRSLLSTPKPDAILEGFVLVPVEPTNAMLRAGKEAAENNEKYVESKREYHEIIWSAMIEGATK